MIPYTSKAMKSTHDDTQSFDQPKTNTNKPFMIYKPSNQYRKRIRKSRKTIKWTNGDKQITHVIKKKPPLLLSVQISTTTFPIRTQNTKKNTESTKSNKKTKDQGQRKLAPLPAVLNQPDCSYPDLHSYKIEAQDIESGVRKRLVTFVKD